MSDMPNDGAPIQTGHAGPTGQVGHADYESSPLTRSEYIAAIVHLYRGELYRANSWRIRLDTTTNWAVLTTAGLLAFSFRAHENPHWVLLIGMLLITLLLGYEARRFRFFDVWRARVRKIEENFYGPILRRNPISPDTEWGQRVAQDLLHPSFKITFLAAVRARFLRNYWAIYFVIFLSWILKVALHPVHAASWEDLRRNLTTGPIPWWLAPLYLGILITGAILLVAFAPTAPESERSYWSTAEEQKDLSLLDV